MWGEVADGLFNVQFSAGFYVCVNMYVYCYLLLAHYYNISQKIDIYNIFLLNVHNTLAGHKSSFNITQLHT